MSVSARVFRFHDYGGPEQLKLQEEDIPHPGAGEVRVKVEALSLNQADVLFLANHYVESPQVPSRIGYEIAGVVDTVGEGVEAFAVGDRVSSVPAFSITDYANFAEITILPERGLMKTPSKLNKAEAASFTFAYFTDYYGLFELGDLKPFHTVLVTAASSTTGLAAIAMIRHAGATVIATSRTSSKREVLLKAGASHVIATEEEDLAQRVHEITSGKGVDLAYDCIAGALSEKIIQSLRVQGRWIVYGLMDASPAPFPWLAAVSKPFKIDLYRVFDFTGNRHLGISRNDAGLERGREYVSRGIDHGFPVVIDKVFKGLDQLGEAMAYMKKAAGVGKIVVEL